MERKINPSLLYNDQNLSQEEKNIVYSNIGINNNVNAVVSSYMNNSASMNNETQYQFLNTVSSDIILVSGQPTSGSFSLMYSINPNYTSSVYFNVNSSYSAVSAVVNSNSSKWISAASGTGPIIAEIDNGKINVSHSAYTTENNIGQTFDTTAYFGSDISLVNVLYDKYGHITSGNGFSVTMPTIYTTTDLSGEGNDDSFLGLNSKVNDNISSGTSAFTWIKNNSSLMTESYLQKASAFGSVNSGNNFNWMLGSGLNPYSQNNSVIIGRYNAQETAFSPVITIGNGTSNTSRNNLYTLSNSGMIIAGFSNTSQDSIGTLIMGDGNIIKNVTLTTSPKNNLIFGQQNTASDATYQFIHGNANLNSGDHSVVIGNANNCYNNYSFIGGLNNVSNGDFDAILGSQNVAPYSWNTCIGSNLSASNTNQLVLGYYNSAISGQAMIVGNGDANTRKNLLMLGYDGTLNLSGSTLNPKDIIAMKTCVNNVSSNSANWDWKYNVSAGANISITTATDQHNVTYTVIGQNNTGGRVYSLNSNIPSISVATTSAGDTVNWTLNGSATTINSAIQNTNSIMKLSINNSPSAGMTLTDTSNNVYFQHNNSGLFVNSGSSVTGNVTIQGDYYTPISNSNRWAQMILPKITGAGYTTNTMITDTYSIKCNVISGTYTSASFADNNFYFIAE